MTKLIALVAVACMVDGERQTIEPGQELPKLTEHDARELKRLGAVQDVDEVAAAEKAAKREEARASKEFQREREAVQQAAASTNPA